MLPALLLSLALLLSARQTQTPVIAEALRYEGQTIEQITFAPAEQPLTPVQLAARLPFHAGSQFHEQDLRVAIQSLFSSGRYADISVDAHEGAGGVDLLIQTKPAYFVGHVQVLGVKQPPNNGQLMAATKLKLGTAFVEADKNQAAESLRDILRQNGFYSAQVTAEVQYEPKWEQARISFRVNDGKRAHYESPLVAGDPDRTSVGVIRATRWKRLYGFLNLGWQQVTEARTRQGVENIRRYYEKHNLLESSVTLTKLDYHEASNTVQPSIQIDAGPHIKVRIVGARISSSRLLQIVPIFQERSLDTDLLVEGDRSIAQYLQDQGYYEAEVTHSVASGKTPKEQIVSYQVTRGSRHKFVHLEIVGNHYFPYQTIRDRISVEPASLPRYPFGKFGRDYLRQDLQSVQNLYLSNGFRDVKVTPVILDDYKDVENHLAVVIQIEEGKQWLVSGIQLEGIAAEDQKQIDVMLASSKNQPYSDVSIADDRDNILNYYYSRGYLNATFDLFATPDPNAKTVSLRYVVKPGPRKYVRQVLVAGLDTTRSSLVFDRMELKAGQPLSLSQETDSQRRLYDLGIFARVNTAIQNPDSDEDEKYVLYDMDEASHYSLNFGVGAQIARIGGGVTSLDNPAGSTGFAPRVAVGVSRINLFGLGQTLGLQTAASTIEQKAALTYFIPQFVSNEKLSLTLTALIENSNDIETFTAHRREGSIQLSQKISRAFTFQYRLVFRNVTLDHLKINNLLVPLLSQPETVGQGEFTIIQDRRDDPTDAHSGYYNTLNLSYAPGELGSQTHFARGLFRNSTYKAFGRDFVFARTTQFGVISRTGGKDSIPLAERLYSGGSTSLRSFPDFQAGPRDTVSGFPLGGSALFTNTFELRFPLFGDNLGGVLFNDAGNVYTSLNDLSFRFRQRNLQDFNYMVQGFGFGIRYRTPIGPVRLDLSFSPDAPRFFGLKGTEQDLINNTAISTVQKINAFQFHFSLGQAF
jgi:outer membrane protein assembly complex protein YaeT